MAWPFQFLPQQATNPSLITPQLCSRHPALTETKEPAGGVAWPDSSLSPSQATLNRCSKIIRH